MTDRNCRETPKEDPKSIIDLHPELHDMRQKQIEVNELFSLLKTRQGIDLAGSLTAICKQRTKQQIRGVSNPVVDVGNSLKYLENGRAVEPKEKRKAIPVPRSSIRKRMRSFREVPPRYVPEWHKMPKPRVNTEFSSAELDLFGLEDKPDDSDHFSE